VASSLARTQSPLICAERSFDQDVGQLDRIGARRLVAMGEDAEPMRVFVRGRAARRGPRRSVRYDQRGNKELPAVPDAVLENTQI
jgi:hypothetical protein